jgi:hypothetical protein
MLRKCLDGKVLIKRANRRFVKAWAKEKGFDDIIYKTYNSTLTKTLFVVVGDFNYELCSVYNNGYIDFKYFDESVYIELLSLIKVIERKRKISIILE